jgi:hypothetical protein
MSSENNNLELNCKLLEHNYKYKDNWDGSFCPDYCIGCGDCDHFPTKYAVQGYIQTVKNIHYYCEKCYNAPTNTAVAKFFAINKCMDDELTDITIDCKELVCKKCKNTISNDDKIINYEYTTRIICCDCGEKNKLDTITWSREKKYFYCESCETKYKLNLNDKNIIKCEEISKLDEYKSKQLFVSVDGTSSYREIIEIVE